MVTPANHPPSSSAPPRGIRLLSWMREVAGLAMEDGGAPWPRRSLNREQWLLLRRELLNGAWTLVDLWAEGKQVHAALLDETGAPDHPAETAILTLECPEGGYPSLARARFGAIRLERAIRDLWGLEAEGAEDRRPWLDHGRFPRPHPLASESSPNGASHVASLEPSPPPPYPFYRAEGEGVHQIPVGPIHAGIIEPGHFRFHCNGETVVRLEQRLGYLHRGVEGLMRGRPLREAASLAGRISGDSVAGYAIAFAQAAERAAGVEAPERGVWLRAAMGELERVANHLGDIGALCNDAGFPLIHGHCGWLREQVLRAAHHCFSHRLMRDRVIPGGVAADLHRDEIARLLGLIRDLRPHFEEIVSVYHEKTSLLDRTLSTGVVEPTLAFLLGAGGFVGRASGRAFDARTTPGYAPYHLIPMTVPPREEGDVHARLMIRVDEARASLNGLVTLLDNLPEGPVRVEVPPVSGEGAALVEGFRGDIWLWLRLEKGKVAACRARDPSWFQWPLLERAVKNDIVADFPLCNKSFNCSYAGCDL